MARRDDSIKMIAENRKARFSYAIDDTLEVGIVLTGSEVKSLRGGKTTIAESYAHAKDGEIFLVNAYIPEYNEASRFNHEPKRTRKLLLHKREVAKLAAATQREGMTLIPLKMYFNAKGKAKLQLGIAKGKKLHDKRETEKQRDWARDKGRLLRNRG
jgi:SsrA-binding protein